MSQLNYVFKRVLQILPVLLVVTVCIFFMLRLLPGDPATVLLGEKATPEMVEAIHKRLGLDRPLLVQYGLFLKSLFQFDLGNSIHYAIPVSELFKRRLGLTIVLTLMSAFFSVCMSFPLGYIAGVHKDRIQDQIIRTGALVALSIPSFWVGLLLLIFFGLKLHWFPVGGWGETWPEHLHSLVLPAFTQALVTSTLLTRNLRNSVVDVLRSDYVDFARSKGLSERLVRSRHVIRNALISTVTLLAMRMAYMLGGSIIIETVFALPGVGSLMVEAIFTRDYAVVQAVVFIFAFMVLLVNLLTDVAYSLLDPRVTLE